MTTLLPPISTASPAPARYEIGIDEAGRGPLFGRVYAAAVILPYTASGVVAMDLTDIKDSKKFHSKRKIQAVADYIKENAVAWAVNYEEAEVVDRINIRRANFAAMHSCITEIVGKTGCTNENTMLYIDGNDFIPYITFCKNTQKLRAFPHETVVGGDSLYPAISAASILAKVSRDAYIEDLCEARPELKEKYGLHKNMGYGTKQHIDGIITHGITDLHRRTFTRKWAGAEAPTEKEV